MLSIEGAINSIEKIGRAIRKLGVGPLVLVALYLHGACASAQSTDSSADEGNSADSVSYRGGSIRIGAFAIADISSRIYYGPSDLPIALPIDIQEDLGVSDSLLAFRGAFSYRFSKRHSMTVGYYQFELEGIRELVRTIEIGGSEFEIGLDVASRYEEKILKIAYDFIFHDDDKVLLSISPGLHISSIDFGIAALPNLPAPGPSEDASVTAPWPMLGGRIRYRLTPKWSMALSSDVFLLSLGDQRGAITDSSFVFEYQSNSAFGFGVGLNRYTIDLDIDDGDKRWDVQSVYSGAYLYGIYKF
jgi:hypothetical protein